jgi:hypothetical protein
MKHDYLEFSDVLDNNEYGLIVSPEGDIKGIWVPAHLENQPRLPANICKMCVEYFGVDPNDTSALHTIH